jgi:hypothetical protein
MSSTETSVFLIVAFCGNHMTRKHCTRLPQRHVEQGFNAGLKMYNESTIHRDLSHNLDYKLYCGTC